MIENNLTYPDLLDFAKNCGLKSIRCQYFTIRNLEFTLSRFEETVKRKIENNINPKNDAECRNIKKILFYIHQEVKSGNYE